MRVERPEAERFAGFEPGDHVSVTWEGAHDGKLHVLNGTLVGKPGHAVEVISPSGRNSVCIARDLVKTIAKTR